MLISNHGRNSTNVKTDKSLGAVPYTNIFSLSSSFDATSTTWKLCTTLSELKDLPHAQLTSASKVKVASTNANDTVLGTGARIVSLAGLVNYQFAEELVFMDGTTPVESVNTYDKLLEVTIIQFGSNTDTDTGDSISHGDIWVGTGTFTAGVPANKITGIDQSENDPTSRTGILTVPDGKFAFIRDIFCSLEPDNTTDGAVQLMVALKVFGFPDTFWFKSYNIYYDKTYNYLPEFIAPLPPKTDIQLRVRKLTATNRVGTINMTIELQDWRT